jgi:two-component system, LuxR family, response regulator FixJ
MQGEPVIHVVDDDEAVRDSLQFLLEAAGFRVRCVASGPELLALLPLPEPSCILLDVRMPEMEGVTVLAKLREQGVRTPVIVMTGHADVPLAVRAMKAGADDFIEKPFTDSEILESIRSRLTQGRGGHDISGSAEITARLAELTPREREVLNGLVAGLPNKSIAFELGISPRTVEIHRARVMEKMRARNLSELVRLSLAAGINPDRGT